MKIFVPMNDTKYLIAYLAPLATFLGIYWGGYWSPGIIYVGFVLIPLLELFMQGTTANLTAAEEVRRSKSVFFDVLLYLNLPLLYGLLYYYFWTMTTHHLTTFEYIGMTFNMGSAVGIMGINVAHELGHRVRRFEQVLAKLLLLPALYIHFIIEHNLGHHKHVSTPQDPSSARFGETIYAFFVRSVVQAYRHAWQIESRLLARQDHPFWSRHNRMLWFQLAQLLYLLTVAYWFGWWAAGLAVVVAIIGFLHLEAVNYIEHYGLQRRQLPSGRYEPVQPHHSWNSNHELGRIFLYELTRHSDHHYKATRKYQILRHFDESPQLPYGYPGSMLIALVPPLWFGLMNKKVKSHEPLGND